MFRFLPEEHLFKDKNDKGYSPAFEALLKAQHLDQDSLLAIINNEFVLLDEIEAETENTALHLAIKHELTSDSTVVLAATLGKTAAHVLNNLNKDNDSPLSLTIRKRSFDMTRVLLGHNGITYTGMDDIDIWTLEVGDVVMKLLRLQNNLPELGSRFGEHDQTMLHEVTKRQRLDVVEYLVEEGKKEGLDLVREADSQGRLPLHCAIEVGSKEITKYFLETRPDDRLEAKEDWQKRNAFHTAVMFQQAEVLNELLDHQPTAEALNSLDKDQQAPIHMAIEAGQSVSDYKCLEVLLKKGQQLGLQVTKKDSSNSTIVHTAIQEKKWELSRRIVGLSCSLHYTPNECPSHGTDGVDNVKNNEMNGSLPICILFNHLDEGNDDGQEATETEDDNEVVKTFIHFFSHNDSHCSEKQLLDIFKREDYVKRLCDLRWIEIFSYLSQSWKDKVDEQGKRRNLLYHVAKHDQRAILENLLKDTSIKGRWLGESKGNDAALAAFEANNLYTCEKIIELIDDTDQLMNDLEEFLTEKHKQDPEYAMNQLGEAAKQSCEKLFRLLIKQSPKISKKILHDIETKLKQKESTTILHNVCMGGSIKIYELLQESMPQFRDKLRFINHLDEKGNTALHVAASRPTQGKIEIILKLISEGVDPSKKNKDNRTFLDMSVNTKSMVRQKLEQADEAEFRAMSADQEGLKKFIKLGDDDILQEILTKFKDHPSNEDTHPIDLIQDIWPYAKADKMPNSFKQLLLWEIRHHGSDKEELKNCCKNKLNNTYHLRVYEHISKLVPEKMTLTYYAQKLSNRLFILFLVLNFFDYITDLTVTVNYHNEWENFLKDYPNRTECQTRETIGCYLNDIDELAPFLFSLIVILAGLVAEFALVTIRTSASVFRAYMTGTCCCPAKLATAPKIRMYWVLFWYIWMQSMVTQVYEFFIHEFVEYWQSYTGREDVDAAQLIKRKSDDCPKCRGCDSSTCICIACNRHAPDRKDILEKLKDNALFLRCKSKLIVACTENSFMPLLQLSLLFPSVVYLFPKDLDKVDTSDITDVTKAVGSNWRFIVTVTSIVLSVISMATSFTELYFTKRGKQQFKNKKRWIVFFFSIIFQVVGRLMCFQAFTYGVLAQDSGPQLMHLGMTLVALLHILLWTLIFYVKLELEDDVEGLKHKDKSCTKDTMDKAIKALIYGFSSLYVFIEFKLDENEECYWKERPSAANHNNNNNNNNNSEQAQTGSDNGGEGYRVNWMMHTAFDLCMLVENGILLGFGTMYIVDENFNRPTFALTQVAFIATGLTFKLIYYSFLHPWTSLHPWKEKRRYPFVVVVVLYFIIMGVLTFFVQSQTLRITGIFFFVGCFIVVIPNPMSLSIS